MATAEEIDDMFLGDAEVYSTFTLLLSFLQMHAKCFMSLLAYQLKTDADIRILYVFIDSWYFDTICFVDVYRHVTGYWLLY